jgi:hypothetical protein
MVHGALATSGQLLRDWSRLIVSDIEFEWSAYSVVEGESTESKVMISVRRGGDAVGVGGLFPADVVPTESEVLETISTFAKQLGIPD